MNYNGESKEGVVRLSLGWLTAGFIAVALFGVIGGLIGQAIMGPASVSMPLDPENKMITNIQEVKISPNLATAELVKRHSRSVWILKDESSGQNVTAMALTSDGILATAEEEIHNTEKAYDFEGKPWQIEAVGSDPLYGLSYYRIREGLVTPLDMRSEDSPEGTTLIALGLNSRTYTPHADAFFIHEYALPESSDPAGVQRYAAGSKLSGSGLAGAPVLDEEGKVAGILTGASEGKLLPISQVRASFERALAKQLEINPLQAAGFSVNYVFLPERQGEAVRFMAEAATVIPGGEADKAGLKRGDLITAVGDETLAWQKSFSGQISANKQLALKVLREGKDSIITLKNTPAESPK